MYGCRLLQFESLLHMSQNRIENSKDPIVSPRSIFGSIGHVLSDELSALNQDQWAEAVRSRHWMPDLAWTVYLWSDKLRLRVATRYYECLILLKAISKRAEIFNLQNAVFIGRHSCVIFNTCLSPFKLFDNLLDSQQAHF